MSVQAIPVEILRFLLPVLHGQLLIFGRTHCCLPRSMATSPSEQNCLHHGGGTAHEAGAEDHPAPWRWGCPGIGVDSKKGRSYPRVHHSINSGLAFHCWNEVREPQKCQVYAETWRPSCWLLSGRVRRNGEVGCCENVLVAVILLNVSSGKEVTKMLSTVQNSRFGAVGTLFPIISSMYGVIKVLQDENFAFRIK